MSTWTRLVYGTAVLGTLTGTAIFYGGNRTNIKQIDIVELREAAAERLMPFGYKLVTNTLVYHQAIWSQDPSTNRWQQGSNQIPYLVFQGLHDISNQFINS